MRGGKFASPFFVMNQEIYNTAIKLLTKRDYSRFKLSTRLNAKGFSPDEIDEVIEILLEKRFLREEGFTEDRMKSLVLKNYGPYFIEQKLAQEHLVFSDEVLQDLYLQLNLTPEDQIHSLVRKKLISLKSSLTPEEKEAKLLSFVQNKGHCLEQASHIISTLLES